MEAAPLALSLPRARRKASGVPLRAFIFTMDSLSGVLEAAARGGPAGEIRVRTRLQAALEAAGVECDVAHSDAEMESRVRPDGSIPHDFIIMDEWTLVAPGGAVRSFVAGRERDVYLLAFFGLRSAFFSGFALPKDRVLTAFPTSLGGAFLGWDMEPSWAPRPSQCTPERATAACLAEAVAGLPPLPPRQPQGIVWGKKEDYFPPRRAWISAAAALAPLLSTAPPGASLPEGVRRVGTLSPEAWREALGGSSFFLGLGDPLLGPSPLDALSAGLVYINPTFEGSAGGVRGELAQWGSQHPYLAAAVGEPYVCNATLDDTGALRACVERALALDLPPFIPKDFQREAYYARVAALFKDHLYSPE